MKVVKAKAIGLSLEAYLYLRERCLMERCGRHHSEKAIDRLKRNWEQFQVNGFKQYMDGDLGGCVGPIENAWEQRRWTSWSAEEASRMLDEQGLKWIPMADTEYIAV